MSESPSLGQVQIQDASSPRRRFHPNLPTVVAWTCVVVFALVGIGSPLLGRTVFLGSDILVRYPPWVSYGFGDGSVTNSWLSDSIDAIVPQTVLMKHSLLGGDLALWNPYMAGGTALGALPNAGLFSPVSWIWFLVSDTYATGAVKLVEIAVSVTGMAVFTRRLGLSSAAQAVSGLVFVSSGFMIAWTNWPQTRVAALIPLLFWAVDRVVCRRQWSDALPVALVLASMFLGGFPAVLGYAVYSVLVYAVVRLVALRAGRAAWLRATVVGVSGAALGIGLAAWQMVPFVANAISVIDFSSRAQTPDLHLAWTALSTAVVPGILGGPGGSLFGGPVNPIERFSYSGAATLVLVGAAVLVRSRRPTVRAVKLYAFLGAGLCALLIYGGGPVLALAEHFPVFSNNYVTRLRVMLGLFVAVCAGYGFEQIRTPMTFSDEIRSASALKARVRLAARLILVGLAAIAIGVLVRRTLYLVPANAIDAIRTQTFIAAGVVALCGLAVLLLWLTRWRGWSVVATVVIPVALVGQALFVVSSWWPRTPLSSFYPVTATHTFLSQNLGSERYISVGQTLLPGTSTMYKQRAANGHAFHTSQWKALLTAADDKAMVSPTYSVTSLQGLTSPALDRMAVRYGVADPGVSIPGRLEQLGEVTSSAVVDRGEGIASRPFKGAIRGVLFDLPRGLDVVGNGGVQVKVVAADGKVLASTTRILTTSHAASKVWVALAAESIDQETSVRVVLQGVRTPSLVVPTNDDPSWAVSLVRGGDDLKVVHAGDATIYQRTSAAGRFRWASAAVVVADEKARVQLISSGKVDATSVVLERAADARALDGSSTAKVEVLADTGDGLRIAVDAAGSGFFVVADSLRGGGWTASVDGHTAPLLPADEAMSAVYLTSGHHVVELSYAAPGLRTGAAISAISLLVLLVGGSSAVVRRRSRRRAGIAKAKA